MLEAYRKSWKTEKRVYAAVASASAQECGALQSSLERERAEETVNHCRIDEARCWKHTERVGRQLNTEKRVYIHLLQ